VTAAIVVAVAPGLAWYGNWARHATYDLVAIQNQFADAVPPGEMVAGGDSALFLMQSRAKTVVVGLNTNEGNLYAQGARWYLLASDAANPNDAAIPLVSRKPFGRPAIASCARAGEAAPSASSMCDSSRGSRSGATLSGEPGNLEHRLRRPYRPVVVVSSVLLVQASTTARRACRSP